MGFKINKFFLLITITLLQSCSGGRIGNFLEASFKNIEEPNTKEDIKNNLKNKIFVKPVGIEEKNKNIEKPRIKEDIKNNLKNKMFDKPVGIVEKNENIEEPNTKEDIKNNLKYKKIKKSEKSKNNKKITEKDISFQDKQYKPQSYKIIFILKDVDPKDPTEDLRNILRNSEVNFEIEKIERFFDPKNKTNKKN